MNNAGFLKPKLILILVILVIIFGIVIFILYRQKQQAKTELKSMQTGLKNTTTIDSGKDNITETSGTENTNDQWSRYVNSRYSYSILYPKDWVYAILDIIAQNIAPEGIVKFGFKDTDDIVRISLFLNSLTDQIEASKYNISFTQEEEINIDNLVAKKQIGKVGGKGEEYKDVIIIYIPRDQSSTYVITLNNINYNEEFEKMYKSFQIIK